MTGPVKPTSVTSTPLKNSSPVNQNSHAISDGKRQRVDKHVYFPDVNAESTEVDIEPKAKKQKLEHTQENIIFKSQMVKDSLTVKTAEIPIAPLVREKNLDPTETRLVVAPAKMGQMLGIPGAVTTASIKFLGLVGNTPAPADLKNAAEVIGVGIVLYVAGFVTANVWNAILDKQNNEPKISVPKRKESPSQAPGG